MKKLLIAGCIILAAACSNGPDTENAADSTPRTDITPNSNGDTSVTDTTLQGKKDSTLNRSDTASMSN